jgi:hypothetical protein
MPDILHVAYRKEKRKLIWFTFRVRDFLSSDLYLASYKYGSHRSYIRRISLCHGREAGSPIVRRKVIWSTECFGAEVQNSVVLKCRMFWCWSAEYYGAELQSFMTLKCRIVLKCRILWCWSAECNGAEVQNVMVLKCRVLYAEVQNTMVLKRRMLWCWSAGYYGVGSADVMVRKVTVELCDPSSWNWLFHCST